MKKIFLAAKYFAMEEKSELVELRHIESALKNLILIDEKKYAYIFEFLNKNIELQNSSVISEESISRASNYRKINFSKEVKKFKSLLESNGLNFNKEITHFIQDKSKNIADLFKFDDLKTQLQQKIFAQDNAIEIVIDKLVELSYASDKQSVKGIFFFLGPPATGKTYFAESLSKILDDYSIETFDMSNYSSSNQGFALIGLSKGFTNAGEGKLTSFVKEHPKSICLLDEIEKAHPEIQNSLLQIMARGKGKDEFSQEEIDFSESIFIFTSNLGSELYNNNSFLEKMKNDYVNAQSMILEAIGREKYATSAGEIPKIKPEFLSRIAQGDIVLFNKLSLDAFYKIAHQKFLEYIDSFESKYGIKVICNDLEAFLYIHIFTFAPIIDARRIKSKLAFKIFDRMTDYMRQKKSKEDVDFSNLEIHIVLGDDAKLFIKNHLKNDKKTKSQFLHSLFRKNETVVVNNEIKQVSNILTITYNTPEIKKLPKSKDFSDEDGALIFEIPEISFTDVAGHTSVKKRLNEIISYLKNSKKISDLGVSIPRGMLLYGPPGTGKTMLAKAFANEAQLPFISTTGTEILNLKLMKNIYKRAREYAPSIVFIDEIDAIGYRDGSNKDIIITQFLTELNGFSDDLNETVFTISATNAPQKLDPAIMRSGRIDLDVKIDSLDKEARGFFIDKILENPHEKNIEKEKLITFSSGMSGADLEKVKRESTLEMIRQNKEELTEDILIEQINIIKYGERLNQKSLKFLIESTAYHEASHAVLSHVLMPEIKIEQITVTPRNEALGFVSYNVEDLSQNLTYKDIQNNVCVAFAGRVAQIKKFGKEEGVDSGASSDLDQAMRSLYNAVAIFGMDETIGYVNISSIGDKLTRGGLALDIEKRIQQLIQELEKKTFDLVKQYWEKIEKVSLVLISEGFIDEKDFLKIIK